MPLEHLFDAELTYRGDGTADRARRGAADRQWRRERPWPAGAGALRWTLFEGGGELVSTMNPILAIRTEDGASIGIEGRGYAHRASRASQMWRVAATLLFSVNEGSYAWLDGGLGVWEGEFDADQHSARYRAFVQAPAGQDGQ